MKKIQVMYTIIFVLLIQFFATAARYTVSKSGNANFSTIQAAVDMATSDDEIVILDVGVYEEQVTIDSTKNGLYLHSENPEKLRKPVIQHCDKHNVQPETSEETRQIETITYNKNGALRIIGAFGVIIEGVIVDGGGRVPFAYPAVWGGIEPQFHGNAAITLCKASDCIVRQCELRNAYYGLYCHDWSSGAAFSYSEEPMVFPEEGVPFSAFARVGNHLVEHNRICSNTWGIYFESLRGIGSTVRYNLIYDNHHERSDQAAVVVSMPGGSGQAGGAVVFKNARFTPIAFHNNTFYHNYLLFAGLGGVGTQHLIFNNIYAAPWMLWGSDPVFPNPPEAIDAYFVNRMFNCIYSCQAELPETTTVAILDSMYDDDAGSWVSIDTSVKAISRIRIMNGMEQVKPGMTIRIPVTLSTKTAIFTVTVPDVIKPGNLITASNTIKPFPEEANVRWTEIPFLSTDPDNQNFLVPDWANELVTNYIIDQGWEGSGIKDPDGSRADLGAIPSGTNSFESVFIARPAVPITISDNKAVITLLVLPKIGEINQPKIVMSGVVTDLDTSDVSGSTCKPISMNQIHKVTLGEIALKEGSNTFSVPVPAALGNFAFFEFVVEGNDERGFQYTSSVGFIPYRTFDYYLDVTIQDTGKTKTLTEVKAGVPVNIHIEALTGGTRVKSTISPLALSLGSNSNLFTEAGVRINSIPGGISGGEGNITAVFHTVPIGGIDQVKVVGIFGDIPFLAASDDVKILPGDPDHVSWHDPASGMKKIIPVESVVPIVAKVFDLYDNLITEPPVTVHCESTKPDIGIIVSKDVQSDPTGQITFLPVIKNGEKGDEFSIVATLPATGKSDTAILTIGDPSPVNVPRPRNMKKVAYICDLYTLQGRRISSFSAGEHILTAIPSHGIFKRLGRGSYIMRLTDIATKKKITLQRICIRK